MRIVFMGTPDFSVPSLSKIHNSAHEVVAVYSQPPRRAGRGMGERKSPVHAFAHEAGIPVFTPKSLRSVADQQTFTSHGVDVAIVIAYGLILPKPILEAPRWGCFNLHASKLPRWRGAAPIQRAIMAGDKETAIMVMHMDEGLDTGPVCLAEAMAIAPEMTAGELHDALSIKGADLVLRAIEAIEGQTITETPQTDEGVTYAAKIEKNESKIDFSRDARDVHDHIRGLSPFPGAWFEVKRNGKSERIKVLRSKIINGHGPAGEVLPMEPAPVVSCAKGAIHLERVQRAGKRPASGEEFLRGFKMETGTILL